MQTLTPEQLQGLIRDFVADMLTTWESHTLARPVSEEVWFTELEHLQMTKAEESEELARRDFSRVSRIADRELTAAGLTLDPASMDFRRLCVELLKASMLLSDVWSARHQGDYSMTNAQVMAEAVAKVDVPAEYVPSAFPATAAASTSSQAQQKRTLLVQVIAAHTAEQMKAGEWTDKSRRAFHAFYNTFLEVAGQGIAVEEITPEHVREFKATLQKLPVSRNRRPEYEGKTLSELVAMYDAGEVPKTLGITTVNKYLNGLSGLLSYAKRNGYIASNPAESMYLKSPKREDEGREPFTTDELHLLFHSPEYLGDAHQHPYQFWMPILALFTGARQNELAQLFLDDIRHEEGVLVFDLNTRAPDKKLKNKAAKRLIPVHPFLVDELGLVTYTKELQARGEVRLFPELPRKADGYGEAVGRWFNGRRASTPGYREKCGVPKGKTFHSFRHTFIHEARVKRVGEETIARVVGHTYKGAIRSAYIHPIVEHHQELILKLDFRQTISLDHLKASKFARVQG